MRSAVYKVHEGRRYKLAGYDQISLGTHVCLTWPSGTKGVATVTSKRKTSSGEVKIGVGSEVYGLTEFHERATLGTGRPYGDDVGRSCKHLNASASSFFIDLAGHVRDNVTKPGHLANFAHHKIADWEQPDNKGMTTWRLTWQCSKDKDSRISTCDICHPSPDMNVGQLINYLEDGMPGDVLLVSAIKGQAGVLDLGEAIDVIIDSQVPF